MATSEEAPAAAAPLERADPGPPDEPCAGGASRTWSLLYGAVALLGLPVLLWRRFVQGKDREGRAQKWGEVPARPEHPKRIWIHAVSVGEALATWTVCQEIRRQVPGAEIVLSTTTQTGQEVARKRYGEDVVFYFPYDFAGAVKKTFDRVKPTLIVLMELEVWPNFTREALARGVPVVVLNGRITERSGGRYAKGWWLLGSSFRRVRRWMMQSDEYAERIRGLGVDAARVEVAGNVKYDAVHTEPIAADERNAMRSELAIADGAPVLIGGSVHPGEEAALLGAYRILQGKMPGLRLIVVPRHPQAHDLYEKAIVSHGYPCMRRSALKAQGEAAWAARDADARERAVLLVDTMGELKDMYRAADVAFVGGSLIPHGGQNPAEPAGLGLPTVYGPHMFNFTEAVELLKACDGAVAIQHGEELPAVLERLLKDAGNARAMGARARAAFLARQGASAKCVAYLKTLLDGGSHTGLPGP